MTDNSEKILELTKGFLNDDIIGLKGKLTPDSVYAYLYQNSLRLHDSIAVNNKLLNQWLYPMIRNSKKLSPDQAEDLFMLAQELFQPLKSLDLGLAIDIYVGLVEYARASGDLDFLIKSLYWNALSLYYMDKNQFYDEVTKLFAEAAEFRHRYREFSNFETRRYINRSLGNTFVTMGAKKLIIGPETILQAMDTARSFWNDPGIRAFDPEMPWDLFIYSIHQNTCPMLTNLRATKSIGTELAERVYDSAVFLNEYAEKHYNGTQSSQIHSNLEYFLICAKYHTGRMTARETGEKLLRLAGDMKDGDYSLDAVNKITHVHIAALFYLDLDPTYPQDQLMKLKNEHYQSVVAYCSKIPHSVSQFTADSMISTFISAVSQTTDKDTFVDIILKLTTFRHLPTYVHSLTVSWLGELICGFLCDNNPEYLIGVAGTTSADDVLEKRSEIIDNARIGGLCHDVGKIMCINIIANYGRKLSNREFSIIQLHPDAGYSLLVECKYGGIADIARGHHKWYDGSKGYPSDYDHRESKYRSIIDIISVCDTIDMSTDILGRVNAVGLTTAEIIKQITAMSGTKFAPEVATALKDRQLKNDIEHLLNVKRREAYFTAYNYLYTNN